MAKTGEFALIDRIRTLFGDIPSGGIEGIGDDCAVIPSGGGRSTVITTDLLAEGVHFLRRALSPEELGRKSLAVNLSDVAAMGAAPVGSLLSLALPADCRGEWAERFMAGYHELSARYGVPLIGGDTTSSEGGITINVVALGSAPDACIKRRSGARPGDVIAVTGPLGESAAGLRDVLAGRFDTPQARIHHNPTPCVYEGEWLGSRSEVHAMIDLSDGLASDLPHILELSGVGATIHLERIPAPCTLEDALAGGEDYKLLFTARPEDWRQLCGAYRERFGTEPAAVGEVTRKEGDGGPRTAWCSEGRPVEGSWQGFSHF